MIEHKPLPVSGYKAQGQEKIDQVNINKRLEEQVLRRLDEMDGMSPDVIDARWLAIARVQIEIAFMAANRAIFQPGRVKLPGDPA